MRTGIAFAASILIFAITVPVVWTVIAMVYGGGEMLIADGTLHLDRLMDNVLNTIGAVVAGLVIAKVSFETFTGRE